MKRAFPTTALVAMAHFVTGLIANVETLEAFAHKHSLQPPMPLTQGLAILALLDTDLASFLSPPLTERPDGFNYLSRQLLEELQGASRGASLMYFETEYFGGDGVQGAVVLVDGTATFGPASAESGPINHALALLGVTVVPPARDEFETIGLDRYRRTEDWLRSSP